mgnify:CR=1 FL=1
MNTFPAIKVNARPRVCMVPLLKFVMLCCDIEHERVYKSLLGIGKVEIPDELEENWRRILLDNLKYPQDTFYVDLPAQGDDVSQTYVYASFMPSGKQLLEIYDKGKWFSQTIFVPLRKPNNFPRFKKPKLDNQILEKRLGSIFETF